MLYILCVVILLRRKRNGFMWQLTSSTLLFSLETVNLALEVAQVLYRYFGYVSVAENWPDDQYQAFQLERIYPIISAAGQLANLLCLYVQSATPDRAFLTVLTRLAGWLISYWHASLNILRATKIYAHSDLPLLYYLESTKAGARDSSASFPTEHC
jgi:hypothetical protein